MAGNSVDLSCIHTKCGLMSLLQIDSKLEPLYILFIFFKKNG